MKKILIVDDDKNICKITKLYLEKSGYWVEAAHDGEEALALFRAGGHDLVVLDLMLPNLSGEEVCAQIRSFSNVPVIMLTAKGEVENRIDGLKMGADDYMSKPFDPNELSARVESVLRRAPAPETPKAGVRQIGDLMVDESARDVFLKGEKAALPKREFDILLFFIENPNQVFSRSRIIENLWGWDFEGDERVIDVYIKRIRQRLHHEKSAWSLSTVWGVGYKWELKTAGLLS